jgi:hypothetical protein
MLLLVMALVMAPVACGGGAPSSPTTPSTGSSTPVTTPATTTITTPAAFSVALPIRPGEQANSAFGLVPFGVHIGDHGIDGHPGFDIEFTPGASIYAAAAGVVQSVMPGGFGTTGIQIMHNVGARGYRTIYGVETAAPGIAASASVSAGQLLGRAPVYTRTIGRITVTYATTHFQVDDFSSNVGLTNANAMSPDRWLDAAGRAQLETIWRGATYAQELVEPYLSNPRDQNFPYTRTWTRQSGSLAARIDVTAADPTADSYSYVLRDAAGAAIESGTITVEALARPVPTIDLTSSSGVRRGVWEVFESQMQLDYSIPGGSRPATLSGAGTYTTPR